MRSWDAMPVSDVAAPPRRRALKAAAGTLACGLIFFPDLLRVDRWTPFAQLVAFRPVLVAVALVAGSAVMLASRRLRTAGLLVVVTALVGAALVVPRTAGGSPEAGTGRTISVLTANVQASRADVQALAALVREHQPDVVVLPEADADYRRQLARAVPGSEYRGRALAPGHSPVAAMSVLVARDLGPVRFDRLERWTYPGLSVTGGRLGNVRIVGVHAHPPLPRSGVARWKADLSLLRRSCGSSSKPVVVAGDFNASLDHSLLRAAMRGCTDVAAALGEGLRGTWPSALPDWLAPQIDHVFVTRPITPGDIEFFHVPGSDHRAVLAEVVLS